MNKYKSFEKLKEELGDKFEEYMYKANIELLSKIGKAIEELEKEKRSCPASLTLEKAYIIEVEKINKVLSILRGENNEK